MSGQATKVGLRAPPPPPPPGIYIYKKIRLISVRASAFSTTIQYTIHIYTCTIKKYPQQNFDS